MVEWLNIYTENRFKVSAIVIDNDFLFVSCAFHLDCEIQLSILMFFIWIRQNDTLFIRVSSFLNNFLWQLQVKLNFPKPNDNYLGEQYFGICVYIYRRRLEATKPHNQIHMCWNCVVHIDIGIYFIWNLLEFLFEPIFTVMKYAVDTMEKPFIMI